MSSANGLFPPDVRRITTYQLLVGEKVDVSVMAQTDQGSSAKITFDKALVRLDDARNEEGEIIWTFECIAAGQATALITLVIAQEGGAGGVVKAGHVFNISAPSAPSPPAA